MRVVDRVPARCRWSAPRASLSDLETAPGGVRRRRPARSSTTQLLVAPGTPPSVLAAVRARRRTPHRPAQPRSGTLTSCAPTRSASGCGCSSSSAPATLLIAVFGVFASAVLQSRWRSYEVAVAARRRRPPAGAACAPRSLEYVVLLGVAVLLGVLSAYLSLLLVLPSISLGTAGVHDPAPVYATPWAVVAGVAGGAVRARHR